MPAGIGNTEFAFVSRWLKPQLKQIQKSKSKTKSKILEKLNIFPNRTKVLWKPILQKKAFKDHPVEMPFIKLKLT